MNKYKIVNFSTFKTSLKDYNKFVKKIDKNFITLMKDKDLSFILEIEDKDLEKIKNTVIYVFYKVGNNYYFKSSNFIFSKKLSFKKILKEKDHIVSYILKNIDNPKLNKDVSDLTRDFSFLGFSRNI